MRTKSNAAALAALISAGTAWCADSVLPQRDQAENSRLPDLANPEGIQLSHQGPEAAAPASEDDAFGAQMILNERIREKEFQLFCETGVFYTSNAALSRNGTHGDTFLNTSAGLGWRHAFNDRLSLAISGRYSLFRYSRYSVLDFQSAEADVTLGIRLPADWELTLGYGFTQLNARTNGTEFYNENAITVGLQRVFALGDAHALVVGLGPTWGWADPKGAQRDRYSIYLGWRWKATDRLSTAFVYRYAFYDYREGGTGRGDNNQTISLSARYEITDWLALNAAGFTAWNRSNQTVFNYDAWNLGGSISVNARF